MLRSRLATEGVDESVGGVADGADKEVGLWTAAIVAMQRGVVDDEIVEMQANNKVCKCATREPTVDKAAGLGRR